MNMIRIAIALVFLATMFSCTMSAQQVKDVDVKAAKAIIDKGGVTILDVRTPAEYQAGHIAESVLANYNDPAFESMIAKIDKNKPVLVYCAAGGRSSRAAKLMSEKGWKNVSNMLGGMGAWGKAGYVVDFYEEGKGKK
jgi:rhodanese-related sulfurtransferase